MQYRIFLATIADQNYILIFLYQPHGGRIDADALSALAANMGKVGI